MPLLVLLALLSPALAFGEESDLNAHSPGWTELPREGGNITIEEARPTPSPQPSNSPAGDLNTMEAISPEDRELLRVESERRKTFAALNAANPISEEFKMTDLKAKLVQQLGFSPSSLAQASNSKAVIRLASFMTSPEALVEWQRILDTPIRSPWIAISLGWSVFCLVLRSWRLSKVNGFARRMFERLWLHVFFLGGLLVANPWFLYGQPYIRLLSGMVGVLLG